MEPWYKVAEPRKEVREGRSFNPGEFAMPAALLRRDSAEKSLLDAMLLAVPR